MITQNLRFLPVAASLLASTVLTGFAATETDTSTHKETGFEDGNVTPLILCTYQSPNYGTVTTEAGGQDGTRSLKFWWTAAGYDGTRLDRGVEACSTLAITEEGWMGFALKVPSTAYPTNKTTIIAQVFCPGYCNSWAGTLQIRNNALWVEHRGGCGTATLQQIVGDIQRNAWKQIIVHFRFSKNNTGLFEVWYGGTKVYTANGINFGSDATWNGDSLTNGAGLKVGMYCADSANYTANETRTLYYDCVSWLSGNPSNAKDLVDPTK